MMRVGVNHFSSVDAFTPVTDRKMFMAPDVVELHTHTDTHSYTLLELVSEWPSFATESLGLQ